jgi:cellulose synthase operon protein B
MKIHPILLIGRLSLIVAFLLAGLPINDSVFAQAENEMQIPFSQVGGTEIVLKGPYDSKSLSFSLPDNWQLLDGTTLELYIDVFIASDQSAASELEGSVGASLNIYFNRSLQETISLVVGEEKTYRIPIRVQDLNEEDSDGRVQISFLLDAGIDCDYGFHKTTVKIAPKSVINIIHSEKSPNLDLRNLPRPIYKRDSYQPELAKVVISDKASAGELNTAYLVMAAFGRMTNRRLDLEMVTDSQLTQSVRQEANLIFVGKAASLSMLNEVNMPVPINDGRFVSQVLQPEDGVIEMIISPWNPLRTVLIVGGNNDVGVVKAGQALTTGNIQTAALPTVSYIAQVAALESDASQISNSGITTNLDYTLAELGYSIEQAAPSAQTGLGIQYFSYEFNLPFGQIAREEAYFNLIFGHSALIDTTRSEITMFVNDNLAGSVRFTEENTSFAEARIDIAPTVFQPGRNRIDFAAQLIPYNMCASLLSNGLWVSIYPESSIHVQLSNDIGEKPQFLELRSYLYPFLVNPTMSDLTIVLPQTDTTDWISFGDLIYNLGGRATGEVLSFDVRFSDTLSEEDHQDNLILYGMPKNLSLPDELNAALPASFEQNSNVAILDNQTVVYRIEPNKSLGYLELLASPWNGDKTILIVSGTNREGLLLSKQALLESTILAGLKGDFAVIDGERFTVVDTRFGLGLGSFPAAVGTEVVVKDVPTPDVGIEQSDVQTFDFTRQIILIVFILIVVAIFLVILFVLMSQKRQSRRN